MLWTGLVVRARHIALLLCLPVVVCGSLIAGTGTARAASTAVVINEVYGGGGNAGATYKNDFIELRNLSGSSVALTGWSVQYASAAGTSWQVTNLTGSIAAGGLYLVQEAAGTGGTTSLPTPQATGGVNMSATAGKVALANTTTAVTGPTSGNVVDFVGFGTTASQFEGSGPAPAPTSNTISDQRTGGDTDNNAADFGLGAATPGATNVTGGGGGCPSGGTAGTTRIHDITSDSWLSPDDGQSVANVPGIVTGIRTSGGSKGFWIQDPTPDTDSATSEAIFVFTSSAPSCVAAGDSVLVSGTVSNFDPEGNRATTTTSDLTVTEIDSPTTTVLSHANALPAPIAISPTTVPAPYAPDLGGGSIETTPIQPTRSALDYWRSIEGMRVEADNARVVGPSLAFGSGSTLDAEGYITTKPTEAATFRGGTELLGENQTPSGRVEFVPNDGSDPNTDVGDTLGQVVGEVDYSDFGGFLVGSEQLGTITHNRPVPTVVPPAPQDQLSVATYNVENLAPSDPAAKYTALAADLVTNLGSPDVVSVEEIQDNDGATDDGVVAATQTIAKLEAAIVTAGGPQYSAQEIDPVNDQDGGQPGGNIRVVFLYNPARVSFVPGVNGAGGPTTATAVVAQSGQPALTLSPGRIDPTNSAWTSSRKPLAAEFEFEGKPVFVIGNHFDAKLGDQSQDGRFQYPAQSSAIQRAQQATEVHDFTQSILNIDPQASVVVLGDLNDYQFSPAVKTLVTGTADGSGPPILQDLITTLPTDEQYTYDFDGVSEVLDHILVSPGLEGHTGYHVVHINSEYHDQVSDHDPQVVDLSLPSATPGPISGTVTDSTNNGIPNICVYPFDAATGNRTADAAACTDSQGRYTLTLAAPGSYDLVFYDATGTYPTQWYNGVPFEGQATPVTVNNAPVTGINAKLQSAGTGTQITGTVKDAAGNGIANICVYPFDATTGNRTADPAACTSPTGVYDLSLAAPGSYNVVFYDATGTYPTQWYSGAAFEGLATPVTVTAGATASGINAVLGSSSEITGTVKNAAGAGIPNVCVYPFNAATGNRTADPAACTGAAGTYTLSLGAAGSYNVVFYDATGTYLTQWYSGAQFEGQATPVAVTAGATTSGIDATLTS